MVELGLVHTPQKRLCVNSKQIMKSNLQFFKHFNFGLDKRGALGIVAELVDEFLDMGTELCLGLILPLLVLSSLLPCLVEVLIVTSAEGKGDVMKMLLGNKYNRYRYTSLLCDKYC